VKLVTVACDSAHGDSSPKVESFGLCVCAMGLQIDFDGLWNQGTIERLESALRKCIGDPPPGEIWRVSVTSFGSYCVVLVKATQQTCRKVFFMKAAELAEAIPVWLKQYPLQ
jgi:hypothetical protein